MAITIMGGLFVATFLTLLFLPSLYALWYRRSLAHRGGADDVSAGSDDAKESILAPLAVAAE
jgi:hypothetical protein